MYYTITLNPAIDMLTKVENFELGKLNRTGESNYVVGGKGINISLLLKNIGKESKALGFVAGFTGTGPADCMLLVLQEILLKRN